MAGRDLVTRLSGRSHPTIRWSSLTPTAIAGVRSATWHATREGLTSAPGKGPNAASSGRSAGRATCADRARRGVGGPP
jgi:hypothetical protein